MTVIRRRVQIVVSALAMALPLIAAAPAPSAPDYVRAEAKVLAALNQVRSDPQAYVGDLAAYRKQFTGRLVTLAGSRTTYITREGTAPIDEAVGVLAAMGSRAELRAAPVLAAAASDHVLEQSRSGRIGHYSQTGLGPGDRAIRRGGGRMVTEVIAYGAFNPADVVRHKR